MQNLSIPYIHYGKAGQPLVFLHANGYPPECYRIFFSYLTKTYQVTAMVQRPLWESYLPDDLEDWTPFTEDLLRFLDQKASNAPATVIGHSLGGIAALRAALQHPQRFQAIILLDPVLLPPDFIAIWNIALKFNFAHLLHPHITKTLKRRRKFDDLERVFNSYRQRPTFKYFDDESLRACIQGITGSTENGAYLLRYSPEWEAHIYCASIWHDMDIWRNLEQLHIPTLIIRGAETDTFWRRTAERVIRINPAIRVETVERATHLVPLEQPQEVSELIFNFLNEMENL